MLHERQAAMLRLLAAHRATLPDPAAPLSGWRMAEVGCGAGGNLMDMLRLGLQPQHLTGIELLPERLDAARAALPQQVRLLAGMRRRRTSRPAARTSCCSRRCSPRSWTTACSAGSPRRCGGG